MTWYTVPKPAEGGANTFSMQHDDMVQAAFVICFHGHFYAYENKCPHVGTTLDWVEGMFFSEHGQHLMCQTHGALFNPVDGACVSGPCPHGLRTLTVRDHRTHLLVSTPQDTL